MESTRVKSGRTHSTSDLLLSGSNNLPLTHFRNHLLFDTVVRAHMWPSERGPATLNVYGWYMPYTEPKRDRLGHSQDLRSRSTVGPAWLYPRPLHSPDILQRTLLRCSGLGLKCMKWSLTPLSLLMFLLHCLKNNVCWHDTKDVKLRSL